MEMVENYRKIVNYTHHGDAYIFHEDLYLIQGRSLTTSPEMITVSSISVEHPRGGWYALELAPGLIK